MSIKKTIQEKAYDNYIHKHRDNVKHAFAEWGIPICDTLNIDQRRLWDAVVVHDSSKFSKEEFDGYRMWFFPCDEDPSPEIIERAFNEAWAHHCMSNAHHPEFWIERKDGELIVHDMSRVAIAEMILDWTAVSLMKGEDSPIEYWDTKGASKPFSENTYELVCKVFDEVFRPMFRD